MEQKFGKNHLDLQMLQDFCEREGECISYQKGDLMERECEPAQWFCYVAKGCFKYTTKGISDGKEHITWFSFEGEFAGDYPSCLTHRQSQTTIVAMLPSLVYRVNGEQLARMFCSEAATMKMRSIISEHMLAQLRERHLDFYRTNPRERYELLLRRCPGIVEHLPLNVIASFLNISAKTMSMIRHDITFGL